MVEHKCEQANRLEQWAIKFAILENQNTTMTAQLKDMEIKIDKIEIWVDNIKDLINNMSLNFRTQKQEAIEELKSRSINKFASNTEFKMIKKIVFGATGMILIAFFTAIIWIIIQK